MNTDVVRRLRLTRSLCKSRKRERQQRWQSLTSYFYTLYPVLSRGNVNTRVLWMFPAGSKNPLGCSREQNPRHMWLSVDHPAFPKRG